MTIDRMQATRDAQFLEAVGDWLVNHQKAIRRGQWSVAAVYAVLLLTPVFLPLPGNGDYVWNNFTRLAQMIFWGIWWPFVVLSTALVGRMWCGLLCPEGFLSEVASEHGLGRALPRWIQWQGWPTVAFAATTTFGQLVSVYQYPKPAVLILGGSTVAAVAVGCLFGRGKRVWCRYLCPVSKVFGILSKVAPLHFEVSEQRWKTSQMRGDKPAFLNCAPMVALRTMKGGSACHMCGRCSGFRNAIKLARRSPNHEIVHVAGRVANPSETVLIAFGLAGLATAAFHWSANPWFLALRQMLAEWLIAHGAIWPLEASAPWWLLTNYPERNDVMTLLDGVSLILFVVGYAAVVGSTICALSAVGARSLGHWDGARYHHLVQALIPTVGAGLFSGLLSLPIEQLRIDGLVVPHVWLFRETALALCTLWTGYLAWRIGGLYTQSDWRRGCCVAIMTTAASICTLAALGLIL